MPITVGSKLQVWRGEAQRTGGGLKKEDLMKNKRGKVISIKQHNHGKRVYYSSDEKTNKIRGFTRDKEGMAELRAMRKTKSNVE